MATASQTSSLTEQQLKLGQVLMAAGPVTQEFLQAQLDGSSKGKSALGRALSQSGFVGEAELTRVMIARHRIPKINLKNTNIPLKTIAVLDESVARRCRSLPIDRIGKILVIVTPDIFNPDAIAELRNVTGFHVSLIQCAAEGFEEVLGSYYKRLAQNPDIIARVRADLGIAGPRTTGGGAPGRLTALPATDDEIARAVPLDGANVDLGARWEHLFASDGPVEAEEVLL